MARKIKIIITLVLIICSLAIGSSTTRLYVGDFDGTPMAGIDSLITLGNIYIGGDIRTLIRDQINDPERYAVVGFAPDRTDYTFKAGLNLGLVNFEYATTCYHTVISSLAKDAYDEVKYIPNTQTFQMKLAF